MAERERARVMKEEAKAARRGSVKSGGAGETAESEVGEEEDDGTFKGMYGARKLIKQI